VIQILRGDCRAVLTTLSPDSLDGCVTDPPYGLSEHSAEDVAACLRAWLAGEAYEHGKAGFMGKKWDAFVPGPDVWRELYRVLKPGAHALVFAGTRTAGMMEVSLRLAGFEIRDTIEAGGLVSAARLSYRYGSGFPKSLDVGKAIDKAAGAQREVVGYDASRARPNRKYEAGAIGNIGGTGRVSDRTDNGATLTAPATPEAARWDGWGTALKPSYEPIIVARKPLAGTVAANVLKHGTGAINVDGCRIATSDTLSTHSRGDGYDGPAFHHMNPKPTRVQPGQALGRWPPNTLLVHLPECEQAGTRTVASDAHRLSARPNSSVSGTQFGGYEGQSGLAERSPKTEAVPTYRCALGCPVAAIDAQSGPAGAAAQASGATRKGASTSRARNRYGGAPDAAPFYEDAGGASRFSPNFEYSELDVPFLYCAKAPRKEREAGCEELPAGVGGIRNSHPTVKPIALLRWLVRLIIPPGGTVIDPFAGSGSTLVAAVYEGVSGIGIELDQDAAGESAGYGAIAEARVAHAQAVTASAKPTESAESPEPPEAPEPPPEPAQAPRGVASFLSRLRA
jgi:site-specific DNA-methyltransferase (adenine-specific)